MRHNPHPCPDCNRPQPSLIAAAAPPNVVRMLCGICGYPLRYMGAGEWFLQYGGRLDIKDEFRFLELEDDEAIAA